MIGQVSRSRLRVRMSRHSTLSRSYFPATLLIATAFSATPLASLAAQAATLAGVVVADSTNRPIAFAEIGIPALQLSVKADSAGRFSLGGIAAGLQAVTVRAAGYQPALSRLVFTAGQTMDNEFVLRPSAQQLERVNTSAGSAPASGAGLSSAMVAFEERRAHSGGKFVTQADLDDARGRKLADIIRSKVSSVRIVTTNNGRAVATGSRGINTVSKSPSGSTAPLACYVQVIVDGAVAYSAGRNDQPYNIDAMDPTNVAGVEFYTASQTPSQFNSTGGNACGTLVIWTRR